MTSERLYALGIELMDRAVASAANAGDEVSKADAFDYRDGLLIALLALIPLRRRTVAALRIGQQLVKSGDLWALDIPAQDIKTQRPLDYPISPDLSRRIDLYLGKFRCRIPGAEEHDGLWPSNKGRPMDAGTIYDMVRRRNRCGLWVSGQSASLSIRRRDPLVNPRSCQRARCQRPAWSCIIRYNRKALHHGAVAHRGTRPRSCNRPSNKEQLTLNQRVQGSNPCAPTNKIRLLLKTGKSSPPAG